MKKKKIGIFTLWDSHDNYGQILQSFALSTFLTQLGYSPYLIKFFSNHKEKKSRRFFRLISLLFSPKKLIACIQWKLILVRIAEERIKHPRGFDIFRNKYIPSTDLYDIGSLSTALLDFDAFVCGSDQVWNGISPVYFLEFVPKGKKKLAYAASMGGFIPTELECEKIRNYLSDFNYVSLREEKSVELFSSLSLGKAEWVVDPTLLLLSGDYKKLYGNFPKRKPYLFLYLLGSKTSIDVQSIYDYAYKAKLDVVYVGSQGRVDKFPKEYPSVEEWLNLIENASIVVTNSYHGTLFSMIYRKKFVVFLLTGIFKSMNDRIMDLLNKYGLTNRIYDKSMELYENNVDYSLFNKKISTEIESVKRKLLDAIG